MASEREDDPFSVPVVPAEDGVGASKADRTLEDLGYSPELSRNRSLWQVTFMCFILSSVPYRLSTTLSYPLVGGDSANIIWGWLTVSFMIFCVALSLAEITSFYPTAGGVYYQTFVLSLFFVSCLNVLENSAGKGVTNNFQPYQTFLIFLAITLLTHAISAFGNKWLPWLETFAIFWTLAGLIAIVVCLLAIAKQGRHSRGWVFGHFEPQSGWPASWSFCIGLLQAAYATSAIGMIISLCEEVQEPAVMVPKAMVSTVAINTIAGLLFLVPVCFVLPDLKWLVSLASGQLTPPIFKSAIGNQSGAFCLLLPLLILGVICGVGCVTATSRCTWAFARDGGIPGSKWWRTVNKRLGMPLNAMALSMIIEISLGVIYFGSTAAFHAFSGVGVNLPDHELCLSDRRLFDPSTARGY